MGKKKKKNSSKPISTLQAAGMWVKVRVDGKKKESKIRKNLHDKGKKKSFKFDVKKQPKPMKA